MLVKALAGGKKRTAAESGGLLNELQTRFGRTYEDMERAYREVLSQHLFTNSSNGQMAPSDMLMGALK